jgi:hypothetical protein
MKRPAELMVVLDRSGSMTQGILRMDNPMGGMPILSGPQKWAEVTGALDGVIGRTQGEVIWGLKLFPVPGGCDVPPGITVGAALNNQGPLMMAVNGNAPLPPDMGGGSTPTRLAMQATVAFMQMNASPNARHILLATDGLPNCAANNRGQVSSSRDDADGAVAAVAAAAMAGFPTYVVGIATMGDMGAHNTLNRMADAGGRPRNDPTTKYYPVASKDELITALGTITGQIANCTFPLDKVPPVPANVAVNIDGMRIMADPANGWSYGPNNRSIVINGPLCEKLKAGMAKNVQILYGCSDYIP